MATNNLLNEYKTLINRIGYPNLLNLPEEDKQALKNAKSLVEEVDALRRVAEKLQ